MVQKFPLLEVVQACHSLLIPTHISPYLKRNQRDIYYSMIIKPVMLHGSRLLAVKKIF